MNEWSSRVWEDIPKESRDFVKKYMESYPERPMVKLQTGQVVKTEWNAKWWIAKVMQIDASLVQMYFNADGRTEWIYRGSTRLGPLYDELLKANARQQGHHALLNNASHRFPAAINVSKLIINIECVVLLTLLIIHSATVFPMLNTPPQVWKWTRTSRLRTRRGLTRL